MPRQPAALQSTNPDHARHDHGVCVETLLDRARQTFGDKGLKLTTLRLNVLAEIAASHDAMGAYDVIARLAAKTGAKLAPISVYRAIDALLEAGLVHRLESKNAYFACHAPHTGTQRHIAPHIRTARTRHITQHESSLGGRCGAGAGAGVGPAA